MNLDFLEAVFPGADQQLYAHGRVRAIAAVHDPTVGLAAYLVKFVDQFAIEAKLIVPIVQTLHLHSQNHSLSKNYLWGLLIANPEHIPVILLTAKAQTAEKRQFSDLVLLDIITKPFNSLHLPEQIARILHW